MAINRYSGFAFALLRKWARTAFHHECALPTELQRLILQALRHSTKLLVFFQSSAQKDHIWLFLHSVVL
jgi:hypothetical protein